MYCRAMPCMEIPEHMPVLFHFHYRHREWIDCQDAHNDCSFDQLADINEFRIQHLSMEVSIPGLSITAHGPHHPLSPRPNQLLCPD